VEVFLKAGVVLLLAVPTGHIAVRLRLPRVLGYLAGGLIIGPFAFNLLDETFLEAFTPFNIFALSYILFLVGTKIKVEYLKGSLKIVRFAFIFQFFLTFFLVSFGLFFLFKSLSLAFFMGLIGATIAPASTIAVIDEMDAEGPITSSLLLLLSINDLIVIFFFTTLFPVVFKEIGISQIPAHLYLSILKFLVSVALGVILGFFLSYLETKAESSISLTLSAIGIVLLLFGVLRAFKISPYVGSLILGFVVSNASIKHKRVLKELEFFDNLVYVFFFFIAGASMHLNLLVLMLPWVLLYVLMRGLGQFFGAYFGALKGGAEKEEAKALGMGILTQAGLAIGFALLLGEKGEAGKVAMNLLLASTIIFEIGGIILLRKGLFSVGEIRLSHLLEWSTEPILDLHFDAILRNFLRQFGFEKKERKDLKVEDIMLRDYQKLKPSDHLSDIIKAFEKSKCHTIPVVDEDETLRGVVRLEDLEEIIYNRAVERLIVAEDIIRFEIPSLSLNETIKDAAKKFKKIEYDALPVCEKEKIVGVVLRRQILRYI